MHTLHFSCSTVHPLEHLHPARDHSSQGIVAGAWVQTPSVQRNLKCWGSEEKEQESGSAQVIAGEIFVPQSAPMPILWAITEKSADLSSLLKHQQCGFTLLLYSWFTWSISPIWTSKLFSCASWKYSFLKIFSSLLTALHSPNNQRGIFIWLSYIGHLIDYSWLQASASSTVFSFDSITSKTISPALIFSVSILETETRQKNMH